MGSSKSGYEYRYRVSVEDNFTEKQGRRIPRWRTYILEVRTNFILKPIAGAGEEILMDTERFGNRLTVDDEDIPRNLGSRAFSMLSGKNKLDSHIRNRLSKYCMPNAHIRALVQLVFDAVRDPRHDSSHTIPVLAFVDVYTVQLEGEPLDATIDRSVKPDFLIPLRLRLQSSWKDPINDLHLYLHRLPVVRVRGEDVVDRGDVDIDIDSCPICLYGANVRNQANIKKDKYDFHDKHSVSREEGLGLMEVCPICLREPIVGAKIASLPCKHAFHDHCIISWLLKTQWCPLCRVEIKF